MSTTITKLLEKNRTFDAHFNKGFANHLSMSLIALHRLGADSKRLQDYFNYYQKNFLEPLPDKKITLTLDNWKEFLGQQQYFTDYQLFFQQQITRLGKEKLLNDYLPILISGIAADAFHGIIRLAYSLEQEDIGEITAGLAVWADNYLDLGYINVNKPEVTLSAAFEQVNNATEAKSIDKELIFIDQRMHFISQCRWFKKYVPVIEIDKNTQQELANILIRLYLLSDDFTILHAVTSNHALRLLLPYINDKKLAFNYYIRAVITAYLSIKAPCLNLNKPNKKEVSSWDWQVIIQKALTSNDDHIIKFVYTAYQEYLYYQDTNYQYAAQQRLSTR